MTARYCCSSRSVNVPVPLYCIDIGPNLTLTVPEKSSPSTDSTAAPGKHSPTSCRSFNSFQVDRKSTRLNSSHVAISYAVFCLKKQKHAANAQRQSTSYHA